MTALPLDVGDPAACSALGGRLRRAAEDLRADADRLDGSLADLALTWSGPAASRGRQRVERLAYGARSAAAVLDRSGSALQAYAVGAADLDARRRTLLGRARAAGLLVEDGTVRLPPGPRVVADPATEERLEGTRVSVAVGLAEVGTEAARARAVLVAALDTEALDAVARATRR